MSLEDRDGPYGDSALAYVKAGWPEVLPIWKGGQKDKQPMVRGYHGRDGAWPDDTTNKLWARRYARANIALRLSRWIIGLDVDQYDNKYGGESLGDLQDQLGPLPATFVSTARTDGVSGIRLFIVPGDYVNSAWPSQAGPDIEVITWYERYVICAPSMHKTGNKYRWYRQSSKFGDMQEYRIMPGPENMSILPDEWCEYLTGLATSDNGRWEGASFDGSARQWLVDYGGGEPCKYVLGCELRWYDKMLHGSVHESAKMITAQAVKAAAEGHTGVNSVLHEIRAMFIEQLGSRGAGERQRGEGKAVSEWRSLVSGAVSRYGGEVTEEDSVCDELEGF